LQLERWRLPLFQEKYREEKVCDKRKGNVVDDDDDDDDVDDNFDRTVLSQWYRIPWYNFRQSASHCEPGIRK
jgi:hypothetical protein